MLMLSSPLSSQNRRKKIENFVRVGLYFRHYKYHTYILIVSHHSMDSLSISFMSKNCCIFYRINYY